MPPNDSLPVLSDTIETLREHYVDLSLKLFALLSVYVAIMSIARIEQTGWLSLYTLQIGFSATLIALALGKAYLSTRTKTLLMVFIAMAAGMSGVTTFGLLGSGFFYFVLAGLFLAVFYGRRVAYVIIGLGAVYLMAVGILYVYGHLTFPFDSSVYMQHLTSWWTVLFGPFVAGAFMVHLFGDIRQRLVNAMTELETQRDELKWHTHHDYLTTLPNLRFLEQAFPEWVLRSGERDGEICILVMDLDGFKDINDHFGHLEGDYLLKELASRYLAELDAGDTIARIGGDEFVVVMRALENRQPIHDLCRRLIRVSRQPFQMAGGERARIGVSIGGFCFRSGEQIALKEAIHRADSQMYQVKAEGKNNYRVEDSLGDPVLAPDHPLPESQS